MTAKRWKLLCVVGARPNFVKLAPIIEALRATPIDAQIIHTGQHYDADLSERFFAQLGIPRPDKSLGVGSGSHARQTAQVMELLDPIIDVEHPDGVLVVGDVNSTLAAALVTAKKSIAVVHVEAGLRSGNRDMPEEINRLLTDQLSDVLYVTEQTAIENLLREGIPRDSIEFVGNVMVDTLLSHRRTMPPAKETLRQAGHQYATWTDYAVMTLHRPSNVDDGAVLRGLLGAIRDVAIKLPVVFPMHPRTRARIQEFQLDGELESSRVLVMPPVGYLEMGGLMAGARLVMTDSGGIQEETTVLGVPCLTLREDTERPITVSEGTNTIVGTRADRIGEAVTDILATGGKRGRVPELWDGKSAQRIAADLEQRLRDRRLRRTQSAGERK